MSARPWRAAAFLTLAPYQRHYVGHASAKTRDGLERFVAEREGMGFTVEVWEVRPIPEVAQVTQVGASPPG